MKRQKISDSVSRLIPTGVFILLGVLFTHPLIAGQWVTLKPEGGKKTSLLITDKARTYYRLSAGKSMYYDISSPGKYRVYTRMDFGKSKKKEEIYTFRLGIDDEIGTLYSRATKPSKKITATGSNTKIGESRKIELEVQPGAMKLTVRLGKDAGKDVYFRVQRLREEFTKYEDYVFYAPVKYKESVDVSTRENVSIYYRVDSDGLLSVEVNGPTTLKIIARVMMDDTMRGTIKFPIAAYEDGNLKNTYYLAAKNSQTSIILDHPGLLPSRGETLYIEVPKGHHRYGFALPENQRQVILRFYIPKKHLDLKVK